MLAMSNRKKKKVNFCYANKQQKVDSSMTVIGKCFSSDKCLHAVLLIKVRFQSTSEIIHNKNADKCNVSKLIFMLEQIILVKIIQFNRELVQ